VQCELDAKYAVISFVETLSMDNMQAFSKNIQVGYTAMFGLYFLLCWTRFHSATHCKDCLWLLHVADASAISAKQVKSGYPQATTFRSHE